MALTQELAAEYARRHPAAVARLLEGVASGEAALLVAELPPALGAAVVGRCSPLVSSELMQALEKKQAAAVIECIDARLAATLLRRLPDDISRLLLDALSGRQAALIRRVLQYATDQVGSRMDPRPIAAPQNSTVEQVLESLRRAEDSSMHYVYVLDEDQRLVGALSLRELTQAEPQAALSDIMVKRPWSLAASDSLDALVRHPGWRQVPAMPVTDSQGLLVGIIRYSEFRRLEGELGHAKSGSDAQRTTAAIGELFWLGAGALLTFGQTALVGQPPPRDEEDAP